MPCADERKPDAIAIPESCSACVVGTWDSCIGHRRSRDAFEALGGGVNNVDTSRWNEHSYQWKWLDARSSIHHYRSIPPDGTTLGSAAGEPNAPSDLRAKLNSLYGTINTWLPVIQQVFDRWEELCGIDFVYETNDDGAGFSSNSRGILGVRGDIRISGHAMTAIAEFLRTTIFPNMADMVIDTADLFYNSLSSNSLRLRMF